MRDNIRNPRRICLQMMGVASGVGGHHYSARDLGRAFKDAGYEVSYLMIALDVKPTSKAYSAEDGLYRVKLSISEPSTWVQLHTWYTKQQFDAIFCLDELSCRIALMLLPFSHPHIIPIKPGWINSDAWTAACPHFINFSRENFDYYKAHPKYQKTKLHLLPNRVRCIPVDSSLLDDFRGDSRLIEGERVLMAASRISLGDHRDPGKRAVFESAVAMFTELQMATRGWRLILIGTPSDEAALKWIEELAASHEKVDVVIDSKYTGNVSAVFPAAEIVVAMGRTSMEALCSGCVGMVPVGGRKLPLPIIGQTFEIFSYHNFTHRAQDFGDGVLSEVDQLVVDMTSDCQLLEETKAECKEIFDEHLGTDAVIKRYQAIVEDVASRKSGIHCGVWLYSAVRTLVILINARVRKFTQRKRQKR